MEYRIACGQLGAFYVEGMDPKDSACMSPFNTIYSPETPVMQFTGLKDKNGKEIYEGDILSTITGHADCGIVVVWDKKLASFALAKSGWLHRHFFGEAMDPEDCEITGNIHERDEGCRGCSPVL